MGQAKKRTFLATEILRQPLTANTSKVWARLIVPVKIAYAFSFYLKGHHQCAPTEIPPEIEKLVPEWPRDMQLAHTYPLPKYWIVLASTGCPPGDKAMVLTNATKLLCLAALLLVDNKDEEDDYPEHYPEPRYQEITEQERKNFRKAIPASLKATWELFPWTFTIR